MNSLNIAKLLAEKNLLKAGVSISAKIPVTGFGNMSMTSEKRGIIISVKEDGLIASYEQKKNQYTSFEDLTAIEGMTVARFAEAYKIKLKIKRKKQ